MKEQIKIGLLAVIAVTLIVQTFMTPGGNSDSGKNSSVSTLDPLKAGTNVTADDHGHDHDVAAPDKPENNTPPTNVNFDKMEHDFGNIKQKSKNEYLFAFTNTGDNPLIIESATGSCGCTVPEYPKEPVMPGEKGEIKVVYSPGMQKGNQTKTVTINANTEPKVTQLTIKAVVEEVPEENAETNNG